MSAITPTRGEAIMIARRRKKWTLKQLAQKAGINDHVTVWNLERGSGTLDNYAKVYQALGLSLDAACQVSPQSAEEGERAEGTP